MNKAAPRQTFCDRVVRVYARPQPDASHGRPENFNPHCHAIISGGVWTAEGEFLELPSLDTATVCELFRRLLLRRLHHRNVCRNVSSKTPCVSEWGARCHTNLLGRLG